MEVGHQMIDHLEPVARIDEDIRPPGLGADVPALVCNGLERAAGRRPDSPDLAARIARLIDERRSLLVHDIVLGVHHMVGDLLFLDRAEGAQADVQRDKRQLDALLLEFRKQLFGKMQASRRRCRRTGGFGVNRLVALGVVQLFLDIRRQRHRTELIQNFQENALVMEADQAIAVRLNLFDRRGQQAVAKGQLHALACLAPRAGQAFPQAVALIGQQQHLDRRGAPHGVAHQARRDHARIIEYHAVARLHILQQVAEVAVRH